MHEVKRKGVSGFVENGVGLDIEELNNISLKSFRDRGFLYSEVFEAV